MMSPALPLHTLIVICEGCLRMCAGSDLIEGTVMKSPSPTKHVVCLYCGLQSAVTNHASLGECVDALQREVTRLRDQVRQGKPSVPVVSRRQSDEHSPAATSVQFTPFR
jgi:hypothetical protein